VKASHRRARRADILRRRCPDCRYRNLTIYSEWIMCESCGWSGQPKEAPYQACYQPREGK
jgi:hypothetical protein